MCDTGCIEFGKRVIIRSDVEGKDVLEIGSRNMNGSLRGYVENFRPNSYLGIDIDKGDGVDMVCDVKDVCEKFGKERFHLVVCTEMLEHDEDWRTVVSVMKNTLKPEGVLVVTTRSKGCPYHDYPDDFWRFEQKDMEVIFSDMKIFDLDIDCTHPSLAGVFMRAVKPQEFVEEDLSEYKLYSIKTGEMEL